MAGARCVRRRAGDDTVWLQRRRARRSWRSLPCERTSRPRGRRALNSTPRARRRAIRTVWVAGHARTIRRRARADEPEAPKPATWCTRRGASGGTRHARRCGTRRFVRRRCGRVRRRHRSCPSPCSSTTAGHRDPKAARLSAHDADRDCEPVVRQLLTLLLLLLRSCQRRCSRLQERRCLHPPGERGSSRAHRRPSRRKGAEGRRLLSLLNRRKGET